MTPRAPTFPMVLAFFTSAGLPQPTPEHRFDPTRRWRFDYAWPEYKVALEIEGGIWIYGRHTRGAGFCRDLEKYNKATSLGWRVLKTTPRELLTQETIAMVRATMAICA